MTNIKEKEINIKNIWNFDLNRNKDYTLSFILQKASNFLVNNILYE